MAIVCKANKFFLNLLPCRELDKCALLPSSHVNVFQFSQIEMHLHNMIMSASSVHLVDAPHWPKILCHQPSCHVTSSFLSQFPPDFYLPSVYASFLFCLIYLCRSSRINLEERISLFVGQIISTIASL